MKTKPSILITGATGTIGSELARILSEKGIPYRALVRSEDNAKKLSELPGAEIFIGDLNNPESINHALIGIDRAFLLTNSSERAEYLQNNFVDIASATGVKHIVKLSQLAAAADSPVRFLRYHAAVENSIKQTGITYTFLRPNLFMQGLLGFCEPIKYQGKFFASVGDAPISLVDTRDIAAVAAVALTEPGHENKTYDLTGPESLAHKEIAAQFTDILSRPVSFINVSPEDMRQAVLSVGFPDWQADGLIEDYAHYSRGEAAAVSKTIEDVTGKPARNFRDFLRDYAEAFS